MANTPKKKAHTGGAAWFIIGGAAYLGFLLLFAWQTGSFVNWLFPDDQVVWKVLTVICFDGMALFWACVETFYRFAVRSARGLVSWAWGISFVLSFVASIFYMVIESMFRFQLTVTPQVVDIGYGIVIGAIVLQILFLTFWLRMEWIKRHPHQDEYEDEEEKPASVQSPQPVPTPVPVPAAPAPGLTLADVLQLIKAMQPPAAQAPVPPQPVAQPAPEKQPVPSLADDLADSVQPAPAETQYTVNKPNGPTTEQLPKEPAPAPSGAKLNGK